LVLSRLFRREKESSRIAAVLYGAIVAQARTPALYRDLAVADTLDGRFEMVVLHTVLVLDRLQTDAEASEIAQAVFDVYCTDMDRSLREMGVGDMGVPKRMKAMGERFYGRAASYREALSAGDAPALEDALRRNVYDRADAPAAGLAAYTRAAYDMLASMPDADVKRGVLRFPDAAGFAETRA
jgi:cytochrome b pre-mRNA-processing protein 3